MSTTAIARPTDEDAAAASAAQTLCRQYSFHLSFFAQLLPPNKRDAVRAVVSLFGMLNDAIVEGAKSDIGGAHGLRNHPAVVSQAASSCCSGSNDPLESILSAFSERMDTIIAGQLELPAVESRSPQQHALRAFAIAVQRYSIPKCEFDRYADSFRIGRVRARHATARSLEEELDAAGGSIGRMIGCVVGMTNADAVVGLAAIGKALKYTVALGNLSRDLDGGRIIVPLEAMARARYSERDLINRDANGSLRQLFKSEIARIREWLQLGLNIFNLLAGDRERLAAGWLVVACNQRLKQFEAMPTSTLLSAPDMSASAFSAIRLLPAAWKFARRSNTVKGFRLS